MSDLYLQTYKVMDIENWVFVKLNIVLSLTTLKCLSIGTPENNKFSICPKWKIHYF